jgi:tetratricopeptide (TPR) repeat protein
VPRRPGERASDHRQRVADVERQYAAGREALAKGRPVEARDLLRSVAAAAPTYKDVDGLLRDAEAAVEREGAAAKASAERLEQAREYEKALAAYRRAEQLGVASQEVAPGIQRVQQAMRAAGEKAFTDARQFDGLGRNADAARLYEIAVRYLPEGDPRRAQARQRLEVLAAKRP